MKEDNSIEKFKLLGNFVKELADMSQQFVELKSSELQNRMALKRYRDVFHNFPQRIFVKDRDSNYLLCNDLYARDLQIKAEEISGKQDSHFFPEEYAQKTRTLERQIVETGKAGETEETLWLGGQEITVQIARVPLKDEEGQPAGILGVLWEISEKRKAEEEAKKYRTHLEELVFARTSELERVNVQLQGETASRRKIEEESRSAAEEWNRLRAELQEQAAQGLTATQRIGEQFQQESSSRRRAEEERQRAAEEWQRVRADLEGQLAQRTGELQGLQERIRREEEGNKRLAGEYQTAMEEFRKIRSDLENQLTGQAAELRQVNEQLQREIAERKKAAEALQQSVAQFWTLMDSVEKTLSDLGKDAL